MIINHNLGAMNANRNMGVNASNASKSMEKLSSGLRINRAGDDAAGLAISEKMRGQIRGLDQASANAQDGISMIQTGEGALSETTSILQRMRELAVQGSSDTNDSDSRKAIQTEMNQLTNEVNRIGNTTEFNTQKLLNGGTGTAKTGTLDVAKIAYSSTGKTGTDTLDMLGGTATGVVSNLATTTVSVKKGTFDAGAISTTTASVVATSAGTIGSPLTELVPSYAGGTAAINTAVKTAGANALGTNTVQADVTGVVMQTGALEGKFTVDFANALTGLTDGVESSISIGGKEYSFTAGANVGASAANLLTSLKADAEDVGGTMVGINVAGITVGAGASITFKANAVATDVVVGSVTTASDTDATIAGKIKDGGVAAKYTFELKANFTDGDTITIGGKTFKGTATGAGLNEFAIGAGGANAAADIATTTSNLLTKLQGDAAINVDNVVTAGSPDWTDDDSSITITSKTAGLDTNAANYTGAGLAIGATTTVAGQYKFEIATNFGAGQKVTVAGVDFTAKEAGKGSGLAGALGTNEFTIGADTNATATNLLKAINLSGKFDAANLSTGKDGAGLAVANVAASGLATDLDTIVLKEKVASGSDMATVVGATIGVSSQAEVKGVYNFDVNKDFSAGDSLVVGGKTYTAREAGKGTGAGGIMTANEFEVGGNTSTSIDNLKTVINADASNKYTVAKADSTFFTGNKVVLTEKVASGIDLTFVGKGNVGNVFGVSDFKITNNFATGDVIQIAGKMLLAGAANASAGITGDFAVGATATDTAANIASAITGATATSSQALQDLKANYTVTAASGQLTFTEKVASGKDLANDATNLSIAKNTDGRTDGVVKQSYEFTATALDAGSKVTIGGAEITLAKNGTAAQVATELKAQIDSATTGDIKTKLGDKYDVSVTDGKLTLTQKSAGAETDIAATTATTSYNADGFSATMQIGANTAQSLTVDIADMRANALGISGDGTATTVASKNGAVASYVETASVNNGTTSINTEFSLDISTNDKATAAISVIDDATTAVSAERSKLGAFQNRLEHTISNLGTSSENLTSAESRIRDVDMAKEMSTFSKNNILNQAAQAMLAQANQQPQQVLALLR